MMATLSSEENGFGQDHHRSEISRANKSRVDGPTGVAKWGVPSTDDLALFKPREEKKESKKKEAEEKKKEKPRKKEQIQEKRKSVLRWLRRMLQHPRMLKRPSRRLMKQ